MEAQGYPVSLLVKHEREAKIDRYTSSNTPLASAIFTELDLWFQGSEYWYEICGSTKPCLFRQGWMDKVKAGLNAFSPVWLRFRTSEIFAIDDERVVKARRFLYCYARNGPNKSFQGIFSHFYHPEIFHPILEEERDNFWAHAKNLINVMTYRQFLGLREGKREYDLGFWRDGEKKRIVDELFGGRSVILLDKDVLRAWAFAIELSQIVSDDMLERFRDIPIVVSSDFKTLRGLFIGVGWDASRSDLLMVKYSKKKLDYDEPKGSTQKKQSEAPRNPPFAVPGPAASALPGLLCTFFVQFPVFGINKNAWKYADIFCSRDDIRSEVKAFFKNHSAEFYEIFKKDKTGMGSYREGENSIFLFSGIGSYVFGCFVNDANAVAHFVEIQQRLQSQESSTGKEGLSKEVCKEILQVYAARCGA